jgi:hypothetical protein
VRGESSVGRRNLVLALPIRRHQTTMPILLALEFLPYQILRHLPAKLSRGPPLAGGVTVRMSRGETLTPGALLGEVSLVPHRDKLRPALILDRERTARESSRKQFLIHRSVLRV